MIKTGSMSINLSKGVMVIKPPELLKFNISYLVHPVRPAYFKNVAVKSSKKKQHFFVFIVQLYRKKMW